jgi:hypothetical protein
MTPTRFDFSYRSLRQKAKSRVEWRQVKNARYEQAMEKLELYMLHFGGRQLAKFLLAP